MSGASTDRYVSFCGIDCEGNSARFMQTFLQLLEQGAGDPRWRDYFGGKLQQKEKMQQDNLYFIGAQMNSLYSYLDDCANSGSAGLPELRELLWQIEQECC